MSESNEQHYLAIDLGAESGRVIAGKIGGGKLQLEEVHRFANTPLRLGSGLHWDFGALVANVEEGLRKAAATGRKFVSVSTDSWGVDYVLFDPDGKVMPPVFHYRDARSKLGVERAFERVKWETIFSETGIQFMPINTLFQLCAEDPDRLRSAQMLLGVGDAVNFLLGGAPGVEVSMASTFQLYNPQQRCWSSPLIEALGLPRGVFPEILRSGTVIGTAKSDLGLSGAKVVASCSHDTGAAVVGVPADGGSWAYLSSGTWSLLGVELAAPIINDAARQLNFTNEIGYGSTVRLLKNLSGMWLVQECRREWRRQGRDFDYARLTEMAEAAPPFRSIINPGAEQFLAPENMPHEIAEFCRRTGQPVPENEGAFVRCAFDSLALLYRRSLREIETLIGRTIDRLHVVGGGSNNSFLNQLTADVLEIPVIAGPAEATAAGNIVIQAIALGLLEGVEQARALIRASTPLRRFEPRLRPGFAGVVERFEALQ